MGVSNRNNNQTLDGNTALMCTAGTSIGERLTTAFTECSPGLMRKEVKRIQFSRSDDQCYSYEEIMAWVEEEYADDACVMQSIGWMNSSYETKSRQASVRSKFLFFKILFVAKSFCCLLWREFTFIGEFFELKKISFMRQTLEKLTFDICNVCF